MSHHRDDSPAPAAPPSLRGAVVVLDGEFADLPRDALAGLLTALGAEVREDLAADVTLLAIGAKTRALAALLGASAAERRARSLAAAGQRIAVYDEGDLARAVALATGADSLADAARRAARGELDARAVNPVSAPDASNADPALTALLATLRDGDPAARVAAAEALGARGDRRAATALVDATRDAPHGRWVAATVALCRIGGEEAFGHAVHALNDPRAAERGVRRELVRAIEARGDGEALGALAGAMHAARGAFGADEAAAFGRLVARGVRRWSERDEREPAAPLFSLEWEDAADARTPDELLAMARRAGALETLRDARGAAVHRVALERLEPPRDGRDTPAGYELLQRTARRRGARVWIAGCSLPATLPAACWLALLGPLSER